MIPNLREAASRGLDAQRSAPYPLPEQSNPSNEVTTAMSSAGSPPDPLEVESFMLNIDASLRVHARHQFFTWTQGLLQNLIRHELLICALRSGEPLLFHVDSLATWPVEPAPFNELFRRDTLLVPHLIRTWEDNAFRPISLEIGGASQFAQAPLARELTRAGASGVVVHGTYDVSGKVSTLFVFACKPDTVGQNPVYFTELIVPFLHLAWLRTQVNRPVAEGFGAAPANGPVLTPREQEILKWIHLGKSNMEIGTILGISPLTVKNHVQKILRKLNVQNRAQAVGRGLALRILSM
jgi:transcriptional regulator EpsA